MLRSISFESIVREINARRWSELLCILSAPSAREEERWRRLVPAHEAGELRELPSDMRADSARMYTVLIALVNLGGAEKVVKASASKLSGRTGLSVRTVWRALEDLSDGRLLESGSPEGAPCGGRGGTNVHLVSWATITDLALEQGLQLSLFPESGSQDELGRVAVGHGRPDNSSGRDRPETGLEPVPRGIPPVPQSAFPEEFEIGPPARGTTPCATDRARAFPFSEGEGEEEEFVCINKKPPPPPDPAAEWKRIIGRLSAYPIGAARGAANAARANGWTTQQLDELLDEADRRRVDGVPPFSPGLVYSHLRLQDPGSKIGIESPDYRRAVAEKRQAETNARAAQAQAAATEASAKSARAKEIEQQSRDALEETYGPTLDALSREDLYELAATVGARRGWGIAFLIERGRPTFSTRPAFLEEIGRRASEMINRQEPR